MSGFPASSRSNESYVGGEEEEGVAGRETDEKAIVAIACQLREPRGFGRVRLRRVADVSADSLLPFVGGSVEPGAVVHTDGWGGYNGLAAAGYEHTWTVISATGDPAHVSMPAVHRVASLLKRWLLGTHQGRSATSTLDLYLQEFTFRFNRRSARRAGCSSTAFSRRLRRPRPHPTAPSCSEALTTRRSGQLSGWTPRLAI